MDLCAEMLLAHVPDATMSAGRLRPVFRQPCSQLIKTKPLRNTERLLNRFVLYPRFLRRQRSRFDLFHVVDHTYAQLVHALPAERTGVFCHDLDAFRCLLEPRRDPRPCWFRALARRILSGLQKAAIVFHSTQAVRDEIERHRLVDPKRLVYAPYGVATEFTPDGARSDTPGLFLLHVGSNAPRKRIDVLLQTLAGVRRRISGARLVKVGEPFTVEQQALIDKHDLGAAVTRRDGLSRPEIAALYRSAAAVLLPSEAEGFGLPIIEALACGAPVIASDLPVLREVGGSAAVYAPVGEVEAWVEATTCVIERPVELPPKQVRLDQAAKFTWANHARIIREGYAALA
jgi:glycosyltransferase involved in cell wall biosynthesis